MKIEADIRLLNANLRQRRIALGLTQKELAAMAGIHGTTVCAIETLRTRGSDKVLRRIANVLKVNQADITVDWPVGLPTSECVTKDIPEEALVAYTEIVRERALGLARVADEQADIADKQRYIARAMHSRLSARERMVISKRYGLDDKAQTLEEVGRQLRITRERVWQIERAALGKLRYFSSHLSSLLPGDD